MDEPKPILIPPKVPELRNPTVYKLQPNQWEERDRDKSRNEEKQTEIEKDR